MNTNLNLNAKSNGNGNGSHGRWWSNLWKRSDRSEDGVGAYRRLALQLHYDLSRGDGSRSALLVTPGISALCARGSVPVASCLAEQARRPVLLIDVCPKDPEASRLLQCSGDRGFTDFLANPALPLDDLILPTTSENVSFLAAGANLDSSRPLSSESIKALLAAAETRYDYVLLSGGSVLHDPTVFAVAPFVGCVLLMVIENQTMMEDLDAARDVLTFCNVRKVGLVFTTPMGNEARSL